MNESGNGHTETLMKVRSLPTLCAELFANCWGANQYEIMQWITCSWGRWSDCRSLRKTILLAVSGNAGLYLKYRRELKNIQLSNVHGHRFWVASSVHNFELAIPVPCQYSWRWLQVALYGEVAYHLSYRIGFFNAAKRRRLRSST